AGFPGSLFRRQPSPADRLCARYHAVHYGVDHPAVVDRRMAVSGKAVEGRRTRTPKDYDLYPISDRRSVGYSIGYDGPGISKNGRRRDSSWNRVHSDDHDHADGGHGVHHVAW